MTEQRISDRAPEQHLTVTVENGHGMSWKAKAAGLMMGAAVLSVGAEKLDFIDLPGLSDFTDKAGQTVDEVAENLGHVEEDRQERLSAGDLAPISVDCRAVLESSFTNSEARKEARAFGVDLRSGRIAYSDAEVSMMFCLDSEVSEGLFTETDQLLHADEKYMEKSAGSQASAPETETETRVIYDETIDGFTVLVPTEQMTVFSSVSITDFDFDYETGARLGNILPDALAVGGLNAALEKLEDIDAAIMIASLEEGTNQTVERCAEAAWPQIQKVVEGEYRDAVERVARQKGRKTVPSVEVIFSGPQVAFEKPYPAKQSPTAGRGIERKGLDEDGHIEGCDVTALDEKKPDDRKQDNDKSKPGIDRSSTRLGV